MSTSKKFTADVQSMADSIVRSGNEYFISMKNMSKGRDGKFFISDRLPKIAKFPAIRGSVFNPAFNYGESAIIKRKAGINSHKISSNDSHPDIFFKLEPWFRPESKPVDFERFRTGMEGQA